MLEAARNKLRNWKISDATIADIENSKEQSNITVYADQSGVVLKRRVSVGDYLKEGGVLFDIARLDRVWVLFDAYEEDLAEIGVGDVVYTVPPYPGAPSARGFHLLTQSSTSNPDSLSAGGGG